MFCAEPTKAVWEEVGVAWAELAGEWFAEPPCGEAEPVEAFSPFFLEDFVESLALESCSCYNRQKSYSCA